MQNQNQEIIELITRTADGTTYVIDLVRYALNSDWLVTVDRADNDGHCRTYVGHGTWNEARRRIENMTADLSEIAYCELNLAVSETLEEDESTHTALAAELWRAVVDACCEMED